MLVTIKSAVEHFERLLEFFQTMPTSTGGTEHGYDMVGKDQVEKIPGPGIECKTIQVHDVDDFDFIDACHFCFFPNLYSSKFGAEALARLYQAIARGIRTSIKMRDIP